MKKSARWICSLILIYASILKIYDPENLAEIIMFFGVQNYIVSKIIVYSISLIELIIGFMLVIRPKVKVIKFFSVGIFGVFMLVSLIGYYFGWDNACGCLGKFSFGSFDLKMIIRNLILLVLVLIGTHEINEINSDELIINMNQTE